MILVLLIMMHHYTYMKMMMKTRTIKINLRDTVYDYDNNDTYDDNHIDEIT